MDFIKCAIYVHVTVTVTVDGIYDCFKFKLSRSLSLRLCLNTKRTAQHKKTNYAWITIPLRLHDNVCMQMEICSKMEFHETAFVL